MAEASSDVDMGDIANGTTLPEEVFSEELIEETIEEGDVEDEQAIEDQLEESKMFSLTCTAQT